MPVIRGRVNATRLPEERSKSLLERLVAETEGKPVEGGPVIFEIPLPPLDKIDVTVVWDEWEGVPAEERTRLIAEAYRARADQLALALGVTFAEAVEQGLLPFKVRRAFTPAAGLPEEQIRGAKLAVGGMARPDGSVEMRFPTKQIAEAAAEELSKRLPGIEWRVSHAVD